MIKIQWLSHSCVKIKTASHTLLVDPFLSHNPKAPVTWAEAAEGVTHILLTHGHGDHVGDTVAIAQKHNIPVIAMVELGYWLSKQGVEKAEPVNFGGPLDLGGDHAVTLVPAWHSSAGDKGEYFGTPAGLIIETPEHNIYHAGDTGVFGDMALIHEMYKPSIGFLPIGGRYTMDGSNAAFAARKFFKFKHIFPIHYGTFPQIAPTADAFVRHGKDLPIHVLNPGESMDIE
jgi:L-ascorbate metabolism protein UlaG (beta-lactamase superfamily)